MSACWALSQALASALAPIHASSPNGPASERPKRAGSPITPDDVGDLDAPADGGAKLAEGGRRGRQLDDAAEPRAPVLTAGAVDDLDVPVLWWADEMLAGLSDSVEVLLVGHERRRGGREVGHVS